MKLLAFILSLMVLVFSCLPCADREIGFEQGEHTILVEKSACPSESDHPDDCSPFCTCNCCAGFSMNHSVASIAKPQQLISRQFSSYLPANLIEVSIPVWQPPRL